MLTTSLVTVLTLPLSQKPYSSHRSCSHEPLRASIATCGCWATRALCDMQCSFQPSQLIGNHSTRRSWAQRKCIEQCSAHARAYESWHGKSKAVCRCKLIFTFYPNFHV